MDEDESVPLARRRGGGAAAWLRRRLPVLRWAREYSREGAAADAVAGVTLGLTLVPQSIAYAALANLPVQYGLYSAFVGTMVYVFLGTVKEVSIGPTSLMALLTLQTCRDLPIDFVVLLTFLSGCVVLLMGLLRLGFLVELISPAVTTGFTVATALIVVLAQLKGLLGLSFVAESPLENLRQIAQRWQLVRANDCALAATCCTVLLLLRKLKDIPISPKRYKLKKALWFISIARNALVVFAASTFAFYTYDPEQPLFKLSGKVEPGLPKFGLPPFSTVVGNRTLGFLEMTSKLGSSLILMPFVMVLANIAIAKAFSIITLLALNYLTHYFFFIPKACLSSVLICAVIFMIDVCALRRLWAARRREALLAALTGGVGVLAGVEPAVLCGALASLAALLAELLRRPELRVAQQYKDTYNVSPLARRAAPRCCCGRARWCTSTRSARRRARCARRRTSRRCARCSWTAPRWRCSTTPPSRCSGG